MLKKQQVRNNSVSGIGNMRILAVLLLAGALLSSATAADLYHEPWRPQYHFTPAKNWMNDPNGLVYYKGEYHLFFQYNPFGEKWGHMSWGHAISTDLVHWRELPVALREENGVMIFSGSAVVDWRNSSGLCDSGDPKDPSCLIAIYTGHTSEQQTQNIAYSNDRGRTWTKYSRNPVIDLHMKDFRDPKVFWYAAANKWVMVAALPTEHKVRFFASNDLKHWTALSDFGPAGETGGAWECPDLFELPVDGNRNDMRWVLVVNVNPGGPQGGSAGQYFIGRFDGAHFANENPPEKTLWIDHGKDFYAVTSFSDIPPSDGRRIWIGWLSNWQYANDEPTSPWRTMDSIPRVVKLRKTPEGIRIAQEPIAELAKLREKPIAYRADNLNIKGDALEIVMELELGGAKEAGLQLRMGADEKTVVGIRRDPPEVFIDRTKSGDVSFSPKFAGVHAAPLANATDRHKLHILIDRSSVEVFCDDGETVLSDRIFPSPSSNGVEMYSNGGKARVDSLRVWRLRSTLASHDKRSVAVQMKPPAQRH